MKKYDYYSELYAKGEAMQLESEELWNQYYKEIVHRMEDIVLWINEEGALVNWNIAAVQHLGYEGQELSELTIHTLFKSDFSFDMGNNAPYYKEWPEVIVYRKNNTCFACNMRVLTIRDKHIHSICIMSDIQQRKDLQKKIISLSNELEHALEVKNLFLANVTHELRTPLNGMIGLLTTMDTTGFPEKSMEDICLLKNCCQTMEKIVDQVLDYTKLVAGKLKTNKEIFKVQEWITPIILINQNLAEYKGLHFEVYLDQKLPVLLLGDKEWIGQVLSNLLSNAIKFTKQGSVRLEIVSKAETDTTVTVLFVISDTGIGIKEDQMKYLFQSFSQADSTITRKYGGTGLGLAICKGIVEAMGGTLEVESKYLKGSRFYFELVLEKYDNVLNETIDNQQSSKERRQDFINPTVYNGDKEPNLDYLLSQMSLCIEFGSWERAQVYSHQIKSLLEGLKPELGRWAFRLELACRRKDLEKAKELFETIKMGLKSD